MYRFLPVIILLFLLVTGMKTAHANGFFTLEDAWKMWDQANDPALAIADDNRQIAYAQTKAAKSLRRPLVTVEGNIYHTMLDNSNFTGVDGATTKQATLSIEQPLYRGDQINGGIDSASAKARAASARFLQTRTDIHRQITLAYITAARDALLLDLTMENKKVLTQEHEALKRRFDLGDTQMTDVNQAFSRLERAEAQSKSSEQSAHTSRIALETLLNNKIEGALVLPNMAIVEEKLPLTPEQAVELALQKSDLLAAQRATQQAAEAEVRVAMASGRPTVSAYASMDQQYDPQPGLISDARATTIGVRARWALYDGGLTRANTRTARLQSQRSMHEIAVTERDIKRNILQNWEAWLTSGQERRARAQQVVAASTAEKGVKMAVEMGERNLQDQLDATQETLDAQAAYAAAQASEMAALTNLATALQLF